MKIKRLQLIFWVHLAFGFVEEAVHGVLGDFQQEKKRKNDFSIAISGLFVEWGFHLGIYYISVSI